ncbi:hypothetical protein BLA60_18750 [Actinophytocola xinjiangensis]|uniref:CHAT domain-containing protein n=1 Tax=Actinophytocola xinjiangensis TaxID=485602 RepID=A0A7Z0WLZ6_9PSEU|nr:CHAT domain-containing protein [Actinophytocola xinjiangensis]OLF09810.1 hypothetical protein BLA60_18750 [Actinophytocola xinjiangensis]
MGADLADYSGVERSFVELWERLGHHERTGEVAALHDTEALVDILRPYSVFLAPERGLPPLVVDWEVTLLLATWHHAVGQTAQAAALFSMVNVVAPDAVPEPLRERVRALPVPDVTDLTGAGNESLKAFARWEAEGDRDALEGMVRLSSWAAAGIPDGHPDKPVFLTNLCAGLRGRFSVTGDTADLDNAVAVGWAAVGLAPDDHPELGLILNNLSFACYGRFPRSRSAADLDHAVDLARRAATLAGAPVATCLFNAATALMVRHELRDDLDDLDQSVDTFRRAAASGADPPLLANVLANLALALRTRYNRLGTTADIDAATQAAEDAVAACPAHHPRLAHCLTVIGQVRTARFRHSRDPRDLEIAVDAARRAVAATRDGDPALADRLDTLGLALLRQDVPEAVRVLERAVAVEPDAQYLVSLGRARARLFEETGDLADLDAAVDAGRRGLGEGDQVGAMVALAATLQVRADRMPALDDLDEAIGLLRRVENITSAGHPARANALSELGGAYSARFQITSDLADLDAGIDATRQVVGRDDPERVVDVTNLAGAYQLRFGRTEDLADLRTAVEWGQEALRITPEDHASRAGAEFHLGRAMQSRYERTGEPADLDEAVRLFDSAEARSRTEPVSHAKMLSNLGAALRHRYERRDEPADGDRAIDLSRRAVEVVPAAHPDRAIYLANLTTALFTRATRTGAPQDIEAAVGAARQAVRLTEGQGLGHAINLTTLATALRRRHELTSALTDLDEAIGANRQAVAVAPTDHPLRVVMLSNLSVALMSRYHRTRDAAVLDELIDASLAAVDATPADHAGRPRVLANHANALHQRHLLTGDPGDAEDGLRALRTALRLTPPDHPNRMLYLGNLALALQDRYTRTADPADLDAVIEAGRAAVAAAPAGHPGGGRCRYNLGRALLLRARKSDVDTAVALFKEVAGDDIVPTELRVRGARSWGATAAVLENWAEAVAGYRTAIELLPVLAWHGLDRDDRVSVLGEFAGLASDAAAAALRLGDQEQALRLLEHGRGVLLAQALDARDDLGELSAVDPGLADRVRAVRAELDAAAPDLLTGEPEPDPTERRRALAREWDTLLARARALPGLAGFLRPPSLDRLRGAAAGGPVVVVNVHRDRCDALILTTAGLTTVGLRDLDEDAVARRATALLEALTHTGSATGLWRARQMLTRLLGWLWDTVARPVLDALPGDPERLWWCPTGLLTFLPVHAAGHHGSGDTLLDRVTCSYTPTLRALAETRAGATGAASLLAVGQPATPGLTPLPNAATEIADLAALVPGATVLTGEDATRAAVLAALPAHTHLHFAGHGSQDPLDPAGGALYCADHQRTAPITVGDIARLRLDRAELVFLSACETARGVLTVPDEALHLAGALRLAGFTHVVATQWVVSDAHAARIAARFYAGLGGGASPLASDRAATALRDAVARLRAENPDPVLWASYVHTGP